MSSLNQLSLFDNNAEYYEDPNAGQASLDELSFKVHASLIYKLGESLIEDETTALSELIKNSYDADASICKVNIDTNYTSPENPKAVGLIEIIDNGSGMGINTLINGWLTISNSPKKKMKRAKDEKDRVTSKYQRYPLGDKGLGRLSAQKLGRFMVMVTKKADDIKEFTVTIPWGDFLKNTTIDKIPVKIEETNITTDSSYTRIRITDLFNPHLWEGKEQKEALSNTISKIVSPFKFQGSTFIVKASINGNPVETSENIFSALLSASRARYHFKYENGKVLLSEYYTQNFFYNRKFQESMTKGFRFTDSVIRDFANLPIAKNLDLKIFSDQLDPFQVKGNEGNSSQFSELYTNYRYIINKPLIIEGLNYFDSKDVSQMERDHTSKPLVDEKFKDQDLSINSTTSMDSNIYDPGCFEGDIFEYYLDEKYLNLIYEEMQFSRFAQREEFRELIERYHGIKVSRDGFMIQGYGDGDSGDWLGLSASGKTSGNFFDLRNDAVIGCVYLTGLHNSNLRETTNREGLVKDGYFKNFKKVLDITLRRVNSDRRKLSSAMEKYVSDTIAQIPSDGVSSTYDFSISKINTELSNNSTTIQESKERIETIAHNYASLSRKLSSNPNVSLDEKQQLELFHQEFLAIQKHYESLYGDHANIAKQIDAVKVDFERLNQRIQDLFELAGLGMSVELFTHELERSIASIRDNTQRLLAISTSSSVPAEIIKHLKYIDYALSVLRKQMSYFAPGLRFVRSNKQEFSISEFLNEHYDFYISRCDSNNIKFHLDAPSDRDFTVRINKGMLNQVFDNLLNNSEHWLENSYKDGLITHKEYTITVNDGNTVSIYDNGIGISSDIENILFEPFESKKENGRGLGLYVASSNLSYNNCSIYLLQTRNDFGNRYIFEIDFASIIV